MRWVDALEAIFAELAADPQLSGVPVIRSNEHSELQVPSIAWTVFSEGIDENTNPFRVQFDLYAEGIDAALIIEERIRALHRDVPQTIQGVLMLVQLDDARDNPDPDPEIIHRSLDFEFTPARERVP